MIGYQINAGAGQRPETVLLNGSHGYAAALIRAFVYSRDKVVDIGPAVMTTTPTTVAHKHDPYLNRKTVSVVASGSFVGYECGTVPEATGIQQATLSGWVMRDTAGTYNVNGIRDNSSTAFTLQVWSDNNLFFTVGGAYGYLAWPGNGWHHLAGVYDGSLAGNARGKLYIDGALVSLTYGGSIPASLPAFTTQFNLCSHAPGQTYYGTGSVGDMLLHGTCLPDSTIRRMSDPSNTMYDGLLVNPPRSTWNVGFIAASGAMSGSAALTVTSSATARGTGAMSGSSALSITSSATARGTGLLSGSVSMVLSSSLTNALISGGGARYTVADHRPRYTVADHRPRYTISEAT